jgi:hypothetical protein
MTRWYNTVVQITGTEKELKKGRGCRRVKSRTLWGFTFYNTRNARTHNVGAASTVHGNLLLIVFYTRLKQRMPDIRTYTDGS